MKERIIGAVILVIFVVLVVPIFLDGSPVDGNTVSKQVLLPGQEGRDIKTVVLDRGRSNPIPIASSSDADVDKPVVADLEPNITSSPAPAVQQNTDQVPAVREARPQQQATIAKPAQSTTGMWAVQLGSFSNKQNAENLAIGLRKQGYAAFLSQLQTDSDQLHRVRIGPQKDQQSAEAMAARLLKVGHKGQVLPHP